MTLAPICLFVYNRLWQTSQTIESLKKNILASESDLFIFSDGARDDKEIKAVNDVRRYISTISGFKSVQISFRDKNYGLSNNIISGVSEIINIFGKIIVLEDDLITSPYFLKYMNDALYLYENEQNVISIHGYIYPLKCEVKDYYFIKGADCYGWATWKRGWDFFEKDGSKLLEQLKLRKLFKEFNFNNTYPYVKMLKNQVKGKTSSWAIRWYASAFLNDKLTLYPGKTLVYNTGFGAEGTNTTDSKIGSIINSEVNMQYVELKKIPVVEDIIAKREISKYFKSIRFSRLVSRLKRMVSFN